MSIEALKQVSEAEKQAGQLIAQALAQSKTIIATAKTEGEKAGVAAAEKARQETAVALASQEELAQKGGTDAVARSKKLCGDLEKKASGNMDAAVKFITDRVTGNK